MQTYIDRVKEVNPIINACIDERFEEALADAATVDKILEEGTMTEEQLATQLPLFGVPFSCKEMIGVEGKFSLTLLSENTIKNLWVFCGSDRFFFKICKNGIRYVLKKRGGGRGSKRHPVL